MVGRKVASSPEKEKEWKLKREKFKQLTSKVDVRVTGRDELLVNVVADILHLGEAGPGNLVEVAKVGDLNGFQKLVREDVFALFLWLCSLLNS